MKTNRLSLSAFGHFFVSYALSELISVGGTILFVILFGGVLLLIPDEVQGSLNVNTPSYFVIFFLFYFAFAKKHLYSDKERQRDLLHHTKESFSLASALLYDLKAYGIYDILYYSVCFLPLAIGWWGGPEGAILWCWGSGLSLLGYTHWWVRYLCQIPLFILCYLICMAVIIHAWNRKRPAYLTKGFENENTHA